MENKKLRDFVYWNDFMYTHTIEKQQELLNVQDQDLYSVDLAIRNEFTTFMNDMAEIRPHRYNPRKDMTTNRDTYYMLVQNTYVYHRSRTFPFTKKQEMLFNLLSYTCIYDWLYEAFAFNQKYVVFNNEHAFRASEFTSEDFTAVLGHCCYLFEDVLLVELRKPGEKALSKRQAHEIFQRGGSILFLKCVGWTPFAVISLMVAFGAFSIIGLLISCFFVIPWVWYLYRFIVAAQLSDASVCCTYQVFCGTTPILLYDKKETVVYVPWSFKDSYTYGRGLYCLP